MADLMISDQAIHLLEKSLDVSARRHRIIANNIANQDTIGFQRSDLDFKQTLKREMAGGPGPLERTHPKHLRHRSRSSTGGRNGMNGTGGGPVDIDKEMTHLMENNIKYRSSVEMLLRKMGTLKVAIVEGGK